MHGIYVLMDILGIHNPGHFAIGDTIFTGSKRISYPGIPSFSPEKFAYISNPNPSTYKMFQKGWFAVSEHSILVDDIILAVVFMLLVLLNFMYITLLIVIYVITTSSCVVSVNHSLLLYYGYADIYACGRFE